MAFGGIANTKFGVSTFPTDYAMAPPAVAQAVEMTAVLAAKVPQGMHAFPSGEMPWEDWGRAREVAFTADYLVVDGEAVWLEGGPATWGMWGAHPCCLPPEAVAREPDGEVRCARMREPGAPELPQGQRVG